MNEELMKTLTELAEKFGMAIDWTSQNALPYAQELAGRIIKFEVATSIMWMVVGAACIGSWKFWMKLIRYAGKKAEEDPFSAWDFGRGAAIGGMATSILFGALMIMQQAMDLIKCAVLPEAIILEYLKMVNI